MKPVSKPLDYSPASKNQFRQFMAEWWWAVLCVGILLIPVLFVLYVMLTTEIPNQQ